MGVIFYLYRTLIFLKLSERTVRLFLYAACLLPELVLFSGILLRESIIIFMVSVSDYHFIKWICVNNIMNFIICVFSALVAAALHSGMIGYLACYLVAYSIFDRKKKKLRFTFRSVAPMMVGFVFFVYLVNVGIFTSYFGAVVASEELVDVTAGLVAKVNSIGDAESQYLTWMSVSSPEELVMFAPLSMFYFLFSPVPMDWRGLNDMAAFFFDSFFILCFIWIVIRNLKYAPSVKNSLIKIFSISIFVTVFIHSWGVTSAGAAMRHRTKIVPVLIVMAAIAYDCGYRRKLMVRKKGDQGQVFA
jgi:hypothetical protein